LLIVLPSFPTKAQQVQGPPPEIVDFVFSKETINTNDGTDQVTISVRMSDESGVSSVGGSIRPTKLDIFSEYNDLFNAQSQSIEFEFRDEGEEGCADLDLAFLGDLIGCGTVYDGIWEKTITFPQYSAAGEWQLGGMAASNELGVWITYEQWGSDPLGVPLESMSLQEMFPSKDSTIENLGVENEDITGPELVAWEFTSTPEVINTEETDVEITLFVRVSDSSGVQVMNELSPSISWDVYAQGLGDKYLRYNLELMTEENEGACVGVSAEVQGDLVGCGDIYDGIYSGTETLIRYSKGGIWESSGNTSDVLGNPLYIGDLETPPFFTNEAEEEDITAPVLKSLTISPSTFDSSEGSVEVTLTMGISDNLSGVKSASIGLSPLISPSSQSTEFVSFNRISGSDLDGVFELKVTIPQNAKLGFWAINQIDITDNADNTFAISGFRDLSIAFPDLTLFLANSEMTDEVEIEDDWYIEEWDDFEREEYFYLTHPLMSIKFEAGTVVTKEEGGSFAFHRMLSRKYDSGKYDTLGALISAANTQLDTDLAACDVSEGCKDSQLNTTNLTGQPLHMIKMGIAGLNLSFSKPVVITIAVDEKYLGQTLVIQTFDIDTSTWVNQTSCLVAIVEPESYEHGGGEDGFYRPGPYPACVFSTNHASFFSANVLGVESEQAAVPKAGVGGTSLYWFEKYF
jgi:hypothetical protein